MLLIWCTWGAQFTNHGWTFTNIQEIPQIDKNGNANGEDRKYAIHFGTPGTRHEDACSD